MMQACLQIVMRDLRLALRQGLDAVMVLMFFVITVTLFPLGVGPEPNLLARMAPGVIWVAALLSTMLSLDRLFQHDYEDGSLEQMLLSPVPLEAVVLSKVAAHWLLTGLPLIVASPLLAVFMNMPAGGFGVLILSLLLGTPVASFIGAVGGALTLGARRGGVLISLLVLPFYIPLLIFGVSAVCGDRRIVGATTSSFDRYACCSSAAVDVGRCRGVEAILRMGYLVATERTRCRKFTAPRRYLYRVCIVSRIRTAFSDWAAPSFHGVLALLCCVSPAMSIWGSLCPRWIISKKRCGSCTYMCRPHGWRCSFFRRWRSPVRWPSSGSIRWPT